MSRQKRSKTLLAALPLEIIRLIRHYTDDVEDVLAMMKTCRYMATALEPMLYQQAITTGVHKAKFLYAAIWGHATAVSKFLKAGFSMREFTQNEYWYSLTMRSTSMLKREALREEAHPLLAAAMIGHADVVRILVTEGMVNIDLEDYKQRTALFYVISECRFDVINVLLGQGARLTGERPLKSPFMFAVYTKNKEALEMMYEELQKRSVLPGQKEDMVRLCQKACFHACQDGLIDFVRFFLGQGIVGVNDYFEGRSLLYTATTLRNFAMVRLLVEKFGARMESERDTGVVKTLLGYKSRESVARNLVKYLIQDGCNVANGKRYACALLYIARGTGNRFEHDRDLVQFLKKHGCHQKNCLDPTKCWRGNRYFWKSKPLDKEFWAYVEERL